MPNSSPHLPEVLQAQLDATAQNNEILTELRVNVAKMMSAQEAQAKASDERHHALRNAIATFVPRNELAERFGAINERIRSNEGRIKDLEDTQRWASRRVIVAWFGLIGTGAAAIAHKLNLL